MSREGNERRARVLIVEDHDETRELLVRVVERAGHQVDCAADVRGARSRLLGGGYDAVVLDWMLPDGSGLDLCRAMRAVRDTTPVLILTARGEVGERVEGLDAGADDYLRKPFAMAELLARLRALLRREARPTEPAVRRGALEIRRRERRVLLHGRPIVLTAREFAILELLARAGGNPVSRTDILEALWGEATGSAGASLEVLMSRLRHKLSTPGIGDPIRTHRGIGYALDTGA